MLNDPQKRSKDLPENILSAADLREYCSLPDHASLCIKALTRSDLATLSSLEDKKQAIVDARSLEQSLLTERVGARIFLDSDSDGISDYDEINIYHTNPELADTDGDGFPDGQEILNHTNPNGKTAPTLTTVVSASSTLPTNFTVRHAPEAVTLEDPLLTGIEHKELLKVTTVVVSEVGTNKVGSSTAKKLTISGTALPNSFVTLYIFSTPIIVTVKTDSSGAWVYTLDKELPDGTHQVISAITNDGGHILAKSAPLPFVKVAAAVSIGSDSLLPNQESPGFFSGTSLYAFIAIFIGLIGIAFSIVGFVVHKRSAVSEMDITK
jgi:hypothetical protein